MGLGGALMGGGLLPAPLTTRPWHLYLTIGVMVGAGSVCLGYSGQSLFLPNWFIRRRGLAMGLAFAGVGIGSVTLLPWVQRSEEHTSELQSQSNLVCRLLLEKKKSMTAAKYSRSSLKNRQPLSRLSSIPTAQ